MVLIFKHICLSYASQSKLSLDKALEAAYSQCQALNIYDTVMNQFPAPPKKDFISQLTEFIISFIYI
jgi:hypothetical protein